MEDRKLIVETHKQTRMLWLIAILLDEKNTLAKQLSAFFS